MKKFFSSFGSTGSTSGIGSGSGTGSQASEKYQPEKGVPECAGRTAPVLSVPNKEDAGALVSYRLLMLNGKNKILVSVEGSKELKALDVLEWEKLIRIESLVVDEQLLLLPPKDANVIFVCEITARTSFHESANFTSVQLDYEGACRAEERQLAEDLGRLLLPKGGSKASAADIFLAVSKAKEKEEEEFKEFPVHSPILEVRAPGLMAALKETKEFLATDGRAVTLQVEVKPETFQELLRFIYTGSVSEKKVLLDFGLLKVALKYKVHRLVRLCEQAQAESLEVNSVAAVLRQAESLKVGTEVLKSSCLDFIKHNYGTVSKTKGWKQLAAEYPNLVLADPVLNINNNK
ncbi:PREDICTED: speckle-type POZ protein A-like, partial [Rhagoletis zephyria]|uniref:speckle-type POZ protein A-like n=1 Tax=Rhagoletis zephyria TaxID=28612 RepID=UPI00081121EB